MAETQAPDPVVFSATFPVADLSFAAVLTARGLAELVFSTDERDKRTGWVERWEPHARIVYDVRPFQTLIAQLDAYFAGARPTFSIPLDLRGTAFQVQVWHALLAIPYGQVQTYGQLARTIGRPLAPRAVGAANGANPISILVPCHRLISSQGTLIKYGGGLAMKQRLLSLEGVRLANAAI
ncbi:MAG TPA: methylated-DNA--[protein]-cysteine S-methyltransferase [Herpetosiphonaceae bacterium]